MCKLRRATWMRGLPQRAQRLAKGEAVRAYLVALRSWWPVFLVLTFSLASEPAPAQTRGCVPFTANYPCVYVANASDATVSVINANTNTVISILPVGTSAFPVGIAI